MSALPRGHAVYEGTVWHHRRTPDHRFSQRVTMVWVDVDRIGDLYGHSRLLTDRRWSPIRYRRSDYHGDPTVSLASAARARVHDQLGVDAPGPVFLLASLCTFGYCFNPLAVVWCTDAQAEPVAQLLEVTNTPWGERHTYVIDRRVSAGGPTTAVRFDKAMHVSPFLPMDLTYVLVDAPPAEAINMTLGVEQGGAAIFDAGLVAHRRPLDARSLRRMLLRTPTQRVLVGIHAQALRLWRKGATYLPHPPRTEASR